MPIARKEIAKLPQYEPGKAIEEIKRELGLTNIIKLASNENPYGPSPKVKKALVDELNNLSLYPESIPYELRITLAKNLNVNEEQIIFGNGSDEIIQFIAKTFLSDSDEVITVTHTFPQYRFHSLLQGAKVKLVDLINGKIVLSEFLKQITDNTKIIWLCNPNNPTGTIFTHDELERFLTQIPSSIIVVVDEAYYEYVLDTNYPKTLNLQTRFKNLIILRTFSKIYGLAALRLGYGIFPLEIAQFIKKVRDPFNVNRLAQIAGLVALNDIDYIKELKTLNINELKFLKTGFENLGFNFYEPHGNFILIDIKEPANDLFQFLLKNGVIVRSGIGLGFPTHLRITTGTREQNELLINLIQIFLKNK